MSNLARAFGLGVGLLAACLVAGPRLGEAGESVGLVILREALPAEAPLRTATLYESDSSVWVAATWAAPVGEALSLFARWITPQGDAIDSDAQAVEATATSYAAALSIAGFDHASQHGTWTVRLLNEAGDVLLAETTFELKPAAVDSKPPRLAKAVLYWQDDKGDRFPARAFAHDVEGFSLAAVAHSPLPDGHVLVSVVSDESGRTILSDRGQPFKSDGWGKELDLPGWFIRGQKWAQEGGRFTYRLYWDEHPTPILTLPFEIVAQTRWALIVGVEDYPPLGPKGQDLPGVSVDRALMYDLLTQHYGFPDSRVLVLGDQSATRKNLEAAFEQFQEKVGPRDAFLFYYSGHGTQVPDLNGDEPDGWDEALCTYDASSVDADGVPKLVSTVEGMRGYLVDDDIAALLAKLKTPNVTVIFDSCHSGTAVRDVPTVAPPPSPLKDRSLVLEFSPELLDRAGDGSGVTALPVDSFFEQRDRYVFLSACQPSETSKGGLDGGVFTNMLFKALVTAPGQTWGQLLQRARADALALNPGQYALLEGGGRRFPFSLHEAEDDVPFVRPSYSVLGAVSRRDAAAEADEDTGAPRLLEEGSAGSHLALLGIYTGSAIDAARTPYDVYGSSALGAGRGSLPLPHGRVRSTGTIVHAFLSDRSRPGTYRPQPPCPSATIESGKVNTGDRLVPIAVQAPRSAAYLTFHAPPRATRKNQAALQAVKRALLATPELREKPDWVSVPDYQIQVVHLETEEILGIATHASGGILGVVHGTTNEVVADLEKLVTTRHNRYARALRLTNPSPSFRFDAGLFGSSPIVNPGDRLSVRATVSRPCYVTSLWITARDGAQPAKGQVNARVEPGQPHDLQLSLPATFRGQAMVKLIASTKPLGLDGLQGANPDDTPLLLFQALRDAHGDAGMGEGYVSTDGWAEAAVWFRTE